MIKGIWSLLAAALCVVCSDAVAEAAAPTDVAEHPHRIAQQKASRVGSLLKICSVSLYYEKATDATHEDAELLGSGVFAVKCVEGDKRYFIITAKHLVDVILFGKECTGFQVGLISQNNTAIKRLRIERREEVRIYSDQGNDLAIIDITDIIPDLERTGGRVVAIDLNPSIGAEWDPTSRTVPLVVPLMDYSAIPLRENAQPLVLISSANPSLTELLPNGKDDWAVPFEITEGRLCSQDISRDIQFSGDSFERKRTYQVSFVAIRKGWPGMSGSAVYILGGNHMPLLYGIVIAGCDNGLDVIPIAKAVKLIDTSVTTPVKIIQKN